MDDETPLFREKFRITSARRPGWDYADVGYYFVTINTKNRHPWFGEIQHQRMCLSETGSLVWQCWNAIPQHHPHIVLDRFIVMPDHLHGIIRLNRTATLQRQPNDIIPWQRGVLGAVVNHFKGACSRFIRPIHPDFAWQSRFHDIIIRDNHALGNMRRYIDENPLRWGGKDAL